MPTIAVDFDGVLHDPSNIQPGRRMGLPIPGSKEAMQRLLSSGFTLIIYSNRIQSEASKKHVADYLNYFSIPFSDIAITKPNADIYLDDRALHFSSWEHALSQILAG